MNIKQTIHQFIARDKQLANSQPMFLHMSEQEVRRRLTILEERHHLAITTLLRIIKQLDERPEVQNEN